jgi:hypothetical protein
MTPSPGHLVGLDGEGTGITPLPEKTAYHAHLPEFPPVKLARIRLDQGVPCTEWKLQGNLGFDLLSYKDISSFILYQFMLSLTKST